mmetsp:Transcript_2586/g.4004  ORF Transcript_2586/g.4004 Transcript_2586/m.4004 type:complete len:207 (-) Transcript_2586:2067-2687(-)
MNSLHYAINTDAENLDVVNLLISKGINIDDGTTSHSKTPLMYAAERGHVNIVKTLLKNGASVNLKCSDTGNTALHIVCERPNIEIVRLLATEETFKTFVTLKNKVGATAIDIIEQKQVEIIEDNIDSGQKHKWSEKDRQVVFSIFEHFEDLKQQMEDRATTAANLALSHDEQQKKKKKEPKKQQVSQDTRETERKHLKDQADQLGF